MKGNTEQYKDLITLVNIPVAAQEEKTIKNYWLTINALKIIMICLLIVNIITILLGLNIRRGIYIFTVLFLTIYVWYRNYFSKRLRNILFKDCDPIKSLSMYTSLISHTKRQKNWELHFYNVSICLYYAGRFEDVRKVQSLLIKYCPSNLGHMYYEIIGAKLAFHTMDRDALYNHCSNMSQLKNQVQLNGVMQYIYDETIQYPIYVQMQDKGEYLKLYNHIAFLASPQKTLLTEVKKNYYLYKIALILKDNPKIDKHKMFVIQNGGTLWYQKDILASIKIQ